MGFQIQQRSISYDIWVIPHQSYWIKGPVKSNSVAELEETIRQAADERTLDFAADLRIVTDDGTPVSRWKVWPGRVKKLRVKY